MGGYICINKSAMSGFLQLSLQISMNVSKALITAIKMQLAPTLKEVSCALVTLGTLAMDLLAWVNASINLFFALYQPAMHKHYQALSFPFLCLLTADINECVEGIHDCNQNATCNNTEGSFTCSCNTGYTGNGSSCMGKLICNTVQAHCYVSRTQ